MNTYIHLPGRQIKPEEVRCRNIAYVDYLETFKHRIGALREAVREAQKRGDEDYDYSIRLLIHDVIEKVLET